MTDLTPAEQAIADKIMADMDPALEPGDTSMRRCWKRYAARQAQEAIAAVRPHIYREAAQRLHELCGQDGHGGDCPLICDRGNVVLILEDWAAEMETTVDRGEATDG